MRNQMAKSGRGRPSLGDKAKRQPLNMRTDAATRARIEQAAEESGLSLSQEVERRLDMSFQRDDLLGGSHNSTFMRMVFATIVQIEATNGAKWVEDHDTHRAVHAAIESLIKKLRPKTAIPEQDAIEQAQSEYARAAEASEAAQAALNQAREELGLDTFGPFGFALSPIGSPAPARGIFGGARRRTNLLAPPEGLLSGSTEYRRPPDLTDEQAERLARLEEEAAAARQRVEEAFGPYKAQMTRLDQNVEAARSAGREVAAEQLDRFAPGHATKG